MENNVEKITLELLKTHGVTTELGAQYSIRCQNAQIENIFLDAMDRNTREFVCFLERSEKFREDEVEKIKAGFIDYTFCPQKS